MNHIRHFIKIPFINKSIDFIDLSRIFRDNTVESSIPDYFENKEPPNICYKYNKSNRKAMNRNWNNKKANPTLKTKTGNKRILRIDKIQ